MGGERLVVYLRPSLFPTDFFCVSDTVLTCSYSGSCLLVSGPERKEAAANGSSISDSSATYNSHHSYSRTGILSEV